MPDPVKTQGNGKQKPVVPGGLVQQVPLIPMVGVTSDGSKLVMLRIESPTGMHVFLLGPDQAEALGKMLRQQATQAKLGLQIVEK